MCSRSPLCSRGQEGQQCQKINAPTVQAVHHVAAGQAPEDRVAANPVVVSPVAGRVVSRLLVARIEAAGPAGLAVQVGRQETGALVNQRIVVEGNHAMSVAVVGIG